MARNGDSKRLLLPLEAAADEGPHSGRDGLGVGAHRGSGEVAMLMAQAQQYVALVQPLPKLASILLFVST